MADVNTITSKLGEVGGFNVPPLEGRTTIGGAAYTMQADGTWVPVATPTPVEESGIATKSYVDAIAKLKPKTISEWLAEAASRKLDAELMSASELVKELPQPDWSSIRSTPLDPLSDPLLDMSFGGSSITTGGTIARTAPLINPYSKEALAKLTPRKLLELCEAVHAGIASMYLKEVLLPPDTGFVPYVNLHTGADLVDRGTGGYIALEIGDDCYIGLGTSPASAMADLAYIKAFSEPSKMCVEDVLELVNEFGIETVLGERLTPALVDELDTGVIQ
jgi:hypothetical protein